MIAHNIGLQRTARLRLAAAEAGSFGGFPRWRFFASSCLTLILGLAAVSTSGCSGHSVLTPIRVQTPAYPAKARNARIPGHVVLNLKIDSSGNVQDVFLVNASAPPFVETSTRAAREWRFRPSKAATPRVLTVTFDFVITDSLHAVFESPAYVRIESDAPLDTTHPRS